MSVYFLDTSALVKRYLTETGTVWIRSLVNTENRFVIAQITPIELVSSLARRKRETAISERTMQAAMLLLARHTSREYAVIQLVGSVEKQAKHLLVAYPLRAADAIQLASAQIANHQLIEADLNPLIFVCADTRLLHIAASEGLTIENPNLH